MRRVILITTVMCAFAFVATPASADLISFADTIAGVDGDAPMYGGTVNWSTVNLPVVNLSQQSYSLLDGMATVSAYSNGSDAILSHRLTRGLGVYANELDEVDRVDSIEHIDITFDTMPYYVHEIEVRSLFDPDTGNNEEWAAIAFWKDGSLVQTEYLVGLEDLGVGGTDGDASWSGTPILVDKLVFYVPTRLELTNAGMGIDLGGTTYDPSLSEFAVAKLTVTPIPTSVILGILGMGVVSLKLRKYA